MAKPEIRKPWERHRTTHVIEGVSQTDRSFGNDTDINKIVARFSRRGEIPPPEGRPQYGDVTHLQGDLAEMIVNSRNTLEELKKSKQKEERAKKEEIEQRLEKLEMFEKGLLEGQENHQDNSESETDK